MNKAYKISYKTYFNDRLKEVYLHGMMTYPLYIQVTFERKTIFFKSYYFELFSKPRYFLSAAGKSRGPSIEEITAKENELIEFIINRNLEDFSLELFKEEYAFYSRDICDVTEAGFVDYLYTFFHDEGMPVLATVIKEGSKFRIAYDLVRDMKMALGHAIYDQLIENSFYYAPPYLPVYGFMMETKKWPLLSMTVMEWQAPEIQSLFIQYVSKTYPHQDAATLAGKVNNWIKISG